MANSEVAQRTAYSPDADGQEIERPRKTRSWRGKIAVVALFVISAAGYTGAAFIIDSMSKNFNSLF